MRGASGPAGPLMQRRDDGVLDWTMILLAPEDLVGLERGRPILLGVS